MPRRARPGVHKLVLDCAGPTDELVDFAALESEANANSLQQSHPIGEALSTPEIFANTNVPYPLFGSRGIGVSGGAKLFRIHSFV